MAVKFMLLLILLLNPFSRPGGKFFENELTDIHGRKFSFSELKNSKATAVIFMLTDCPATQDYTLTLNKLAEKYKDKLALIGIIPGKFASIDEMKGFEKTYKIKFRLLQDPEMNVTASLGGKIAPSCLVVDQNGNSIYSGRIDDWFYTLGKKRQVIRENNLDNAIRHVLFHEKLLRSQADAFGCILHYDKD